MKTVLFIFISSLLLHHTNHEKTDDATVKIGDGQMPNITTDAHGNIHLVYGRGDSILYSTSSDRGKTFSKPIVVSVLKELAASHTRGPQIAATANGLVITACNASGNIFSYGKSQTERWTAAARVNDADTIAKENLMALAADGNIAFAVWLDLRNKHNQIWGAKSVDGGRSWSKNILVYASPDKTVCECCKPSAAIRGNNIYVMFRNWLSGNRDLYLAQSTNSGKSFEPAQKLGSGSWHLNACPMDGGALALRNDNRVMTVWNREGSIYACERGQQETKLGNGRSCTVECVNDKVVYAWIENKNITVLKPNGKMTLSKGQSPMLTAINSHEVLCVWENDKQIYRAILEL